MPTNNLICPRITYLSGKECTLDECDTVLKIKLRLCALNPWAPREIMVLYDGRELLNEDPAPEIAYVVLKESEESNELVWRDNLHLVARFGDQAGANRCASKVLSLWDYGMEYGVRMRTCGMEVVKETSAS